MTAVAIVWMIAGTQGIAALSALPEPTVEQAAAQTPARPDDAASGVALPENGQPGEPGPHTIFVRTRLLWVPSFVLSPFLSSYSNALCRAKPGPVARGMGVNRSEACNGMTEAGYRSFFGERSFDVSLGYWHLSMPDSNWLAADEDVASADLTQIDLHLVAIQVGLERQWHFGRKLRRWSWRLGGQLGIGVAAGGVYRTKLGAQPETCTPDSLGDLSKCRPFRAVEFSEPDRNPRYYARCTATHCDPHDLERAGRSRDEVPRIFPTFSFHTGPRYELTRWVQITADVGLSYGLSFGLGCEVRIPNGIAGP